MFLNGVVIYSEKFYKGKIYFILVKMWESFVIGVFDSKNIMI